MNRATVLRWTYRIAIVLACGVAFFFLVFFPIAASFLITNSHFHFRERGPAFTPVLTPYVAVADWYAKHAISLMVLALAGVAELAYRANDGANAPL